MEDHRIRPGSALGHIAPMPFQQNLKMRRSLCFATLYSAMPIWGFGGSWHSVHSHHEVIGIHQVIISGIIAGCHKSLVSPLLHLCLTPSPAALRLPQKNHSVYMASSVEYQLQTV